MTLSRMRAIHWVAAIAALAVQIVGVAAELGAARSITAPPAGAYAAAVLTAFALFLAYRWPAAGVVAILVICLAYHLIGYPGQAPAFALFVAVVALAYRGRAAVALPSAILTAALWSIIPVLPPRPAGWANGSVLGPTLALCIIAAISAFLAAAARQSRAEHAAETAALRASIARDMHDVLAHTISAVTVQTTLALDAFDDDPETARSAVTRARELARAATPRLRHSLLQIRADGRPEAPQPTLDLLDEVLDTARSAGLAVDARVDVDRSRLDAVTELAIARIVQEAVTNVIRHASARRLTCTVFISRDAVVAEVVDDGDRTPGSEGLGIAGMRERTAAVGGELEIGCGEPSGFVVRVSIPLAGPS